MRMAQVTLPFWIRYLVIPLMFVGSAKAFSESAQAVVKHNSTETMRIVALAPHIVEMLYNIGAGDNIVGAVDYSDYPEAAKTIPRVGGYYGMKIEKILELQPDLVIAWQSGNKVSDLEQIAALGLKVVYSHPDKVADVAKELRYLGEITGNVKQAELAAVRFERKLKQIISANKHKAPIKMFYQLWPEPMRTINGETWINQLLEICQGINVFGTNPTEYPQISIENVLVAKPELIIIPDEKSKTVQPKIEWHKWSEIPAVKHEAIIHVNADLMHRFSSRMLLGVEDLCNQTDMIRDKFASANIQH